MSADCPELIDAFRAAALSVTKLYKTSAATQAKARADGYHDCLEDLLAYIDREGMNATDSEGSRIRKWILERLDGQDTISQTLESEDEADKADAPSPPHAQRDGHAPQSSAIRNEAQLKEEAPPTISVVQPSSPRADEADIVVPSQDAFTFQSSIPYPQDAYMNLANLDLSDSQVHNPSSRPSAPTGTPRNAKGRNARSTARTSLGRGAGQKRKVNLAEIFDLGSLGYGNGKDVFGNGGKRNRLA